MPELPLVGNEFAGYRLRSVIGRGGMSVVYQAENPRLGSVIALKVLAPELADDDVFRTRFLEESRTAASMNHPNVIPIYDMGSYNDLLYIAMRYVAGTDMRQMIKKRGRMIPATAVFLIGQAARALDAAHRKGLVHRDVKPGNLLVERGSDEEDPDHVYLADFGITKHAMSRSGLTSTGQFLGTIDYVAPEQIQGTSVTGLADQYSLGCVLYECLTGRVPFEKDLDAAIIWAHVEEMPPMPSTLRPDLPPAVDQVFSRVLAKRPEQRYRNCREFIDAARVSLGPLAVDPQASGPAGNLGSLPTGSLTLDPQVRSHPGSGSGPGSAGGGYPGSVAEPAASGFLAGAAAGPQASAFSGPAAGPQAGRPPRGDTISSHQRQPGSPPPGGDPPGSPPGDGSGRGRSLRPRWLAALAALVVIVAAAGGYVIYRGGLGSHTKSHGTAMPSMSPSMSASPKASPNALMAALLLANKSADAAGQLPPTACKTTSKTIVTCTQPVTGVDKVVFQTYSSLTTLYTAYVADVKSINSGQFQSNFNDCTITATNGEVGWNHQFQHPKTYSVAQMEANMVTDNQAAGRVYCTFYNGAEDMIWTQDDGHMLGWVVGSPHEDVWNWWVAVHHNIGFNGSLPMHM